MGLIVATLVFGFGYARNHRRPAPRSATQDAVAALPDKPATTPPAPASPKPAPRVKKDNDLGFDLVESARAVGIVHPHLLFKPHPSIKNVAPWLTSAGASAAVVDFDDDGRPDVYLTNMEVGSKNRLFRNNGNGTFSEVGDGSGITDVNKDRVSLRAVFFDYDNDGKKDMLLTTSQCSSLYRNVGGKFVDVTKKAGVDHCGLAFAVAAVDYDNDGFLDLIIADYFKPVDFHKPATFKFMQNSLVAADNGGPIAVYHNNRDGTFSRVPGSLGITSPGWTMALGAYDFRGTGRPDLYLATDYNSDRLYFNEGGGKFVDASSTIADKYSKNGMSAEIADVDNDGNPAVYVTNIYEPMYKLGENMLWKWSPKERKLVNVARERRVSQCGWSWGAKFLDLDDDGRQDLVVSNGFISANPNKNYWFAMSTIGSSTGAVLEDTRNWPTMGDASMSGYQKKCLFLNRGARFEDVTDKTGMKDDVSDGRALAAIDYDDSGSLSLLEATQGQPARFYRNERRNANHWIGFKLVGTRSNKDALGAEVEVRLKGRALRRQQQPLNGFMSQSDERLHFGLGKDAVLESVSILWPSGRRQTLPALALDRYHVIQEPSADGK
ncbi:MAG TPA: CRTAC1 family protein [Elusimicrobiota bacterium]|nr:CRTAC1 family protein [Elusimicrobiota bacterium]